MSHEVPRIDAARCYRNLRRDSPFPDAFRLQWSATECRDVALRLFDRCIHHSDSSSLGTFYVGELGPAVYLRWRLVQLLRHVGEPESARQLQTEAMDLASGENAKMTSSKINRVSLLEGKEVGLKAMLAVLLNDSGQAHDAMKVADDLIRRLSSACRALPPSECEVLYGRSGALQVILFLRHSLVLPDLASDSALELARCIIAEGKACAREHPEVKLPLLWKWHGSIYLGAAHGVVGILSTLLSLSAEERRLLDKETGMMSLIRACTERLDSFCWPSGNLDSSIKESHAIDRLVQWCHGAPGHVLLLIKAAEVFDCGSFLERAKDICDKVIWPRGLLTKGVGLCHGISGNAYVLLMVSKYDASFLPKAQYFASFAVERLEELEPRPDRPFSLFEGLAGLCALMIDIADPRQAHFPLYY